MNQKFSDRLKLALNLKNISQKNLADYLGEDRRKINGWTRANKGTPSPEIIGKIAKYLKVSADWLLDGSGEMTLTVETILRDLENAPMVKESDFVFYTSSFIPVVKLPYTNIDETLTEDNVIGIYPKKDTEARRYFAVEQKGDMMLPILKNGDLVLIDSREQVTSGDLACVLLNGKYLIRYYSVLPDGGALLKPTNVNYPEIYLRGEEIQAVFRICETNSITRF